MVAACQALNAHLIAAAMDAHLDQRRVARALVLFENGVDTRAIN
jgi:hypothetical protein